MPYDCVVREPVFYASWRGFSLSDLREVTRRVESLRARVGAPAVYFARIPFDGHIFSGEESSAMLAFLNAILPSCAAVHHVIEGDGFIKSARLATVTSMATQTPRPRDFYVYEDLDRAVDAIRAMHGVDMSDAVRRAPRSDDTSRASSVFRAAARIVEKKK